MKSTRSQHPFEQETVKRFVIVQDGGSGARTRPSAQSDCCEGVWGATKLKNKNLLPSAFVPTAILFRPGSALGEPLANLRFLPKLRIPGPYPTPAWWRMSFLLVHPLPLGLPSVAHSS